MSSVALVTGGTQGIGRATAVALGRAGYAVGITARTAAKVADLVRELQAQGIRAAGVAADVGDSAAVEGMIAAITDQLGPIDVLVNNAGVLIPKPVEVMALEEWDRTFSTNVRSVFLTTRAVLPGMRARKQGDIVNVVSLAGKNGIQHAAAYSASKHAVLGFSRSLMLEVRADNIRVIAVCPGSVDTALMRDQSVLMPKLDRILKPDDVAALIVAALQLPRHAMVSELDVRPTNP